MSLKKNTAGWAFDRIRQDALVQLLNDIQNSESAGYDEEICVKVRSALGGVVNLATTIPDRDGIFKTAVWKLLQEFEELYIKWNKVNGSSGNNIKAREGLRKKMRKKRHQIAHKVRKNFFILGNDLDLQSVDAVYQLFYEATKAAPEILSNLSKAVERYMSKRAAAVSR